MSTSTTNHAATGAATTTGTTPASTTRHPVRTLIAVATWPPLVYLILGVVCLALWLVGTSVQVQTSEAWMLQSPLATTAPLATLGQLWDFVHGIPLACGTAPFIFAWGVQFASMVAPVGIEMPPHPRWRYYLSWTVVITLMVINSCGDYFYSSPYGTWGQLGFTLVILFVTFCLGLFAVMCFVHAFGSMFSSHRP